MHIIGSCTHTHRHTVIVLTCLWNSTGALLSSPLLSLLTYSSVHSFLHPPLREEKISHWLPLTAEWWTTQWRGLSFYCDQEDATLLWSLTLTSLEEEGDKRWEQTKSAAPDLKLENSWWCCLRKSWRCGGMWTTATLTVFFLPLPHSLSFFIWMLSEPTASAFEIQDTFPLFLICLFFTPLSVEFVCLN